MKMEDFINLFEQIGAKRMECKIDVDGKIYKVVIYKHDDTTEIEFGLI